MCEKEEVGVIVRRQFDESCLFERSILTQLSGKKKNNQLNIILSYLNKIDKPLARLIKKQREKNQINKIRNENGAITTTTQKYKGS